VDVSRGNIGTNQDKKQARERKTKELAWAGIKGPTGVHGPDWNNLQISSSYQMETGTKSLQDRQISDGAGSYSPRPLLLAVYKSRQIRSLARAQDFGSVGSPRPLIVIISYQSTLYDTCCGDGCGNGN
jgi:hypothetical protein